MACNFDSTVAMAMCARKLGRVSGTQTTGRSPLVLLTNMEEGSSVVRGRRLREDGSLGVVLRLTRVRAKELMRQGLACAYGEDTWLVGSKGLEAAATSVRVLFDRMPMRGSGGVIAKLVSGGGRVRMSFECAMTYLRTGTGRVVPSARTGAGPIGGPIGGPAGGPAKPSVYNDLKPLPERAAAKAARLKVKMALEFGEESEESEQESEDEPVYKLRRVFRHVGEGSAMQFLVRYSGYSERTWQPIGDFVRVRENQISCVMLTYLRKHNLFVRAALNQRLYKDCDPCTCRSCRKVDAYVRLPDL